MVLEEGEGWAGGPGKDRWTLMHGLRAKGAQSSLGPPTEELWQPQTHGGFLALGSQASPHHRDLPLWLTSSSQAGLQVGQD